MGSYNSISSVEASSALRSASPLDVHTAGAEPEVGASNIPGRPHIYPMPDNPLALLRQLHELLKVRGGAWVWCSSSGGCLRALVLGKPWQLLLFAAGTAGGCLSWRIHLPELPQPPNPTSPHPPITLAPAQLLVDQLRQKCLQEQRSTDRPTGFSALTQDPKEFTLEVGWGGGCRCWLNTTQGLLSGMPSKCR